MRPRKFRSTNRARRSKPCYGTPLDQNGEFYQNLTNAYAFNENFGTIVYNLANNGLGTANNLTFFGSPLPNWVSDINGPVISVSSASDQYLEATQTDILSSVKQFTIFALGTQKNNLAWSVGKLFTTNARLGFTHYTNGNTYFLVDDGSANQYSFYTSVDGYHSIAMVYDGTQSVNTNIVRGYLDGNLQATTFGGTAWPVITPNNQVGFYIGYDAVDVNYSDGRFDLVLIWTTALTSSQIQSLSYDPWQIFQGSAPYWLYQKTSGGTVFLFSNSIFINDGNIGKLNDGVISNENILLTADGCLNSTAGRVSQTASSIVNDGNFTSSAGKIISYIVQLITGDGNLTVSNGVISNEKFLLVGDGNLYSRGGMLSYENLPLTCDGNLISLDGMKSNENTVFIADGNLNSTAGRFSYIYPAWTGDGNFISLDKALWGGTSQFINAGDWSCTDGMTTGFVGMPSSGIWTNDGNLTVSDGVFSHESLSIVGDGNLYSTAGRLSYFNPSLIGDGNFSASDGMISHQNIPFIGDGNFSSTDKVLFGGAAGFINAGDWSSSAGMSGFQTLSSSAYWQADGNLTVSDGLFSHENLSLVADGNLTGAAGRVSYIYPTLTADGNFSSSDKALFGGSISIANDGNLYCTDGMTGFQYLFSNASWNLDGNLLVNPGRISQSTGPFTADGNLIGTAGRISEILSGQIVSDGNLYVNNGRISYIYPILTVDGNFNSKDNVLFGGVQSYTNDGNLYVTDGMTGFQHLFSNANLTLDGNLAVSPGMLSNEKFIINANGDMSINGIKFVQGQVTLSCDGNLSTNVYRGVTRSTAFTGDGNLSISNNGRNSFININFTNAGDLSVYLAETGILELSSNATWSIDGNLTIAGGIKYPVQVYISNEGNLTVVGPPSVGLQYFMNFNLRSNQGINLRLKSIQKIMGL